MQQDGADGAGARWGLVAAGAALIGCCYGFARFAYGLFTPQLQEEFTLTSTLSGVIGAGSYVGYCVAIVLSLALTQRLGPRPVAALAGTVATVGTATVALAPSATVLAVGVLVAGSSTGLASPPLAAAIGRWVAERGRDRAQTVANAGTGLGVLASGPVALLVTDDWRWAWGAFAVVSAAVTAWLLVVVPRGRVREKDGGDPGPRWVPGTTRMLLGAGAMGVASMAVWTFGQDLVAAGDASGPLLPGVAWTVLGAAGIVGGLGGDLVGRVGLAAAWSGSMVVTAAATLGLALAADHAAGVLVAAAVFGAAYIALTGIVLVWGTRLFVADPSYGVTLGFLALAAGQAVGAPLTGAVADGTTLVAAFAGCAAVGVLGACVRPRL